jgi:uroporphyrinogen-III synthase
VIPRVVPPLTGLTVLVTRPLPQAHALAQTIASFGGEAIVFPSVAIEPCDPVASKPPDWNLDWAIFVSVHAVEHGAQLVPKSDALRIAAIGKATASALTAASLPAHVVPGAPFTSEALLAHPEFQISPGQHVLIVRGTGGRETLREALGMRGAAVATLEVYRRVRPTVPPADIEALETRWADEGIDAVTATSLETYANLVELLTPRGRALLERTPLLAPTQRILDGARQAGWNAQGFVTSGADDAAIVGALALWRARARIR